MYFWSQDPRVVISEWIKRTTFNVISKRLSKGLEIVCTRRGPCQSVRDCFDVSGCLSVASAWFGQTVNVARQTTKLENAGREYFRTHVRVFYVKQIILVALQTNAIEETARLKIFMCQEIITHTVQLPSWKAFYVKQIILQNADLCNSIENC
jgi:hypothetical protein